MEAVEILLHHEEKSHVSGQAYVILFTISFIYFLGEIVVALRTVSAPGDFNNSYHFLLFHLSNNLENPFIRVGRLWIGHHRHSRRILRRWCWRPTRTTMKSWKFSWTEALRCRCRMTFGRHGCEEESLLSARKIPLTVFTWRGNGKIVTECCLLELLFTFEKHAAIHSMLSPGLSTLLPLFPFWWIN